MVAPVAAVLRRCETASKGPHVGLDRRTASGAMVSVRSLGLPACVNEFCAVEPVIVVQAGHHLPANGRVNRQVDWLPVGRVANLQPS